MMKYIILTLLLTLSCQKCINPPPAANFTIKKYEGHWYQIAKYQTAGGAYFERDCKCTQMQITNKGEIYAYQSCFNTKEGQTKGVNATLLPLDRPGQYIQKIGFNKVGYWVIQIDENTAVEYDCGETLGIQNYCVHIMSRTPTLPNERLKELSDFALSLGLNSKNLNMTITDQKNCPGRYNLQEN